MGQRIFYAVCRQIVIGGHYDEDGDFYNTFDMQCECFWSREGALASMRVWRARGWTTQLDGPHEVPVNWDTSKVRP